jgi:hypothetical protein
MNLSEREKRLVMLLGVSLVFVLGYYLMTPSGSTISVVTISDSIPMAEKRLEKLRQAAALAPGREEALKKVKLEMAEREAGVIQASTAHEAQADLLQILNRVGKAQSPPIEIRSSEMGQISKLSDDYGEISVSVSFECHIEQLVNFLSDLTSQKEIISTSDVRVGNANQKEKIMPVRLTLHGVVSRKLIPAEKKGVAF